MSTALKDALICEKSRLAATERYLKSEPKSWKLKVQRNEQHAEVERLIKQIQDGKNE